MKHFALILGVLVACAGGSEDAGAPGGERDGGSDGAGEPAPGAVAREPAVPSVRERAGAAPSVGVLDRYDFDDPARTFDLPGRLDEISGLAFSVGGRLLAHDDERGRIHEIDPVTGEVGKHFDLGSGTAMDDFEGIAAVGERLFLVSSRGFLYEFREGPSDADVGYRVVDTGLGAGCEVEGLDYDTRDDVLAFACKRASEGEEYIVIHRLPLSSGAEAAAPIRVDRRGLSTVGLDFDFQASALLVTPEGTMVLLSATTESILEIDRTGGILAGVALSKDRHPQPEGLALGADGTLYIADEENDEDARLTAYAVRRRAGT